MVYVKNLKFYGIYYFQDKKMPLKLIIAQNYIAELSNTATLKPFKKAGLLKPSLLMNFSFPTPQQLGNPGIYRYVNKIFTDNKL